MAFTFLAVYKFKGRHVNLAPLVWFVNALGKTEAWQQPWDVGRCVGGVLTYNWHISPVPDTNKTKYSELESQMYSQKYLIVLQFIKYCRITITIQLLSWAMKCNIK